MAMGTAATIALVGEVLAEAVPALVRLVTSLIDGSEESAEKFRARPITVSIAFGGGDGEAYTVQTSIEAALPDEPKPADPT